MLRVNLLGEQRIVDDASGDVQTRSSRALALLGFLVTRPDVAQSRRAIAGLFWPDSTDAQALTNLRRELHHLRQVFGDDAPVVMTAADLHWRDVASVRVDVREFGREREKAELCAEADDLPGVLTHGDAALAEYRGEFLAGIYDDWALSARTRLEDECVQVCDLVCTTRSRRGDLRGAVDVVRRRIALRPLEESGYRTLMQLQAELGDAAAAVSTYHRCASVLERELGVTPDRSTRAVLREVMTQITPAEPRLMDEQPRRRTGRGGVPLVGREPELHSVQDALRDASAGRAGLALITGGAGVGKTRLIAELARSAQSQGAIVGFSRCFGTAARATLAPVADWLRTPAVRVATAELEPRWRGEIDRLLPAGEGPQPQDAATRAMVDGWQRHRFFEGLSRGLLSVRRPTLLIIDNVQWCDEETLSFLGFLLALAPRAPLLVAGTLRNDAPDERPEVAGWVARMRSARVLSEHSLGPLDAASTASLAEAVAGHPLPASDVDLLHATTGGFPLFVVEAARTAAELGTQPLPIGDLTEVLRNRLAQATEVAREVAGLAAAVGTNFSLDLLTEASDLPQELVVRAVDELWRRRILREYRDGYDFSHDLVRDAAYAQISPPRRWLLHRRIAQGLELLHADDSELVAAQLADQYHRGGRGERAVVYYRRAAELSAAVFAHNEAIRMLSSAASIIETWPAGGPRDRQELAVLEAMAAPINARYGYSSTRLQEVVERCVALAEKLGNRDALLNALAGLWTSRFVQGRTVDGYRVGQRALEVAGPDSDRSAPAHFAIGGSAVSLGRLVEAVHHLELTARLGSGTMSLSVGTRPDVHSTAWLAHALWLLGDEERAFACSRQAVALARNIDHPYNLAVALAYCAVTDQLRGDVDGVRAAVAELTDLCARHEFAYYRDWAVVLHGWSMPDGAGAATIRRGIDALKRGRSFARMPYWLALLADAQAREGAADSARVTLDAALSAGRAQDDLWWLPEVMRLRAAYDDGPAAASRLRAAAELAAAQHSLVLRRRCEQDLAELPPARI